MAKIILRLLVIEKTENGNEKMSRAIAFQFTPTVSKDRIYKVLQSEDLLILERKHWLRLDRSSEPN